LAKDGEAQPDAKYQAAVSPNLKRSLPAGCPRFRQDVVGLANRQRLAEQAAEAA
jgi:hypothetical protein